jgi:hypothetical protein
VAAAAAAVMTTTTMVMARFYQTMAVQNGDRLDFPRVINRIRMRRMMNEITLNIVDLYTNMIVTVFLRFCSFLFHWQIVRASRMFNIVALDHFRS